MNDGKDRQLIDNEDDDQRTRQLKAWLRLGRMLGLCSDVYCLAHDVMLTEREELEVETADDPCLFAVRVWTEVDE